MSELQNKLSEKFDSKDVLQRSAFQGSDKKLDYIPINRVIERLNENFPINPNGPNWDWTINDLRILPEGVIVIGTLTINMRDEKGNYNRITRQGVGADVIGKDIDKACKTAMAEALKKVGHTLGIGLYLWDEDERKQLAKDRIEADRQIKAPVTQEQMNKVRDIKTKLKIENPGLDTLVSEWSNGNLKDRMKLDSSNVESFIKWVETNKLTKKA